MKDKLLFGTIGLLVGVVVMQWTMPAGHAEYVANDSGIISATLSRLNSLGQPRCEVQLLDENGRSWRFGIGTSVEEPLLCWSQTNTVLPVPVGDVKFWGEEFVVTKANEVWIWGNCDYVGTTGWVNCGPWPGSPVAAAQSTWGKVKAKFSGKADKP